LKLGKYCKIIQYVKIYEYLGKFNPPLPSTPPPATFPPPDIFPSLYMLKMEKYGKIIQIYQNYSSISKILAPSSAPSWPPGSLTLYILSHTSPVKNFKNCRIIQKNDIIYINLKKLTPSSAMTIWSLPHSSHTLLHFLS